VSESDRNFRIRDLGVTCFPQPRDGYDLSDPVLLIEFLSPSNQAETWNNVWTYKTTPSVQEILVLRTSSIRANLLRRRPDGTWPEVPETIVDSTLALESIGFQVEVTALYRGTRLAVG
jgi:Uma2 family endonuclease